MFEQLSENWLAFEKKFSPRVQRWMRIASRVFPVFSNVDDMDAVHIRWIRKLRDVDNEMSNMKIVCLLLGICTTSFDESNEGFDGDFRRRTFSFYSSTMVSRSLLESEENFEDVSLQLGDDVASSSRAVTSGDTSSFRSLISSKESSIATPIQLSADDGECEGQVGTLPRSSKRRLTSDRATAISTSREKHPRHTRARRPTESAVSVLERRLRLRLARDADWEDRFGFDVIFYAMHMLLLADLYIAKLKKSEDHRLLVFWSSNLS